MAQGIGSPPEQALRAVEIATEDISTLQNLHKLAKKMGNRFYTSIEQSKHLMELGLNPESADMCYTLLYTDASLTGQSKYNDFPCVLPSFAHGSSAIPCWSLAALLDVLPKGINISTPKPINELGYCCWNQYDEIYANNPIDACYEMIIKLNKLNLP